MRVPCLDVQLRDFSTKRGPRERRVNADDVTARTMGDRLEQIPASPVDLRERDERTGEVVAAPPAKLERVEVFVELPPCLGSFPLRRIPRGHDEVILSRRSSVPALPAGKLPLAENGGTRKTG
jgi:hypothetical protein